eukprot:3825617-Amphidinium_carterae.3
MPNFEQQKKQQRVDWRQTWSLPLALADLYSLERKGERYKARGVCQSSLFWNLIFLKTVFPSVDLLVQMDKQALSLGKMIRVKNDRFMEEG